MLLSAAYPEQVPHGSASSETIILGGAEDIGMLFWGCAIRYAAAGRGAAGGQVDGVVDNLTAALAGPQDEGTRATCEDPDFWQQTDRHLVPAPCCYP